MKSVHYNYHINYYIALYIDSIIYKEAFVLIVEAVFLAVFGNFYCLQIPLALFKHSSFTNYRSIKGHIIQQANFLPLTFHEPRHPCLFLTLFILKLCIKMSLISCWYANLNICLCTFLQSLLDPPQLNPAFLPERLSAWTLQLQQASCQARFLKNTHSIKTWKKCMRHEMGMHYAHNTHAHNGWGGSKAGSTCHSGFIQNENRHNHAG